MNIDVIQLKGPELLVRMKEFGYAEATINQVKYGIHLILRIGGNPEYDSLDDIFTKYVLVNYAKSSIADKRFVFGMIRTYLETGLLLSETGGKSGFQVARPSTYEKMCAEYKKVIDLFKEVNADKNISASTMSSYCSAVAVLLFRMEILYGITRLEDIEEEHLLGALISTDGKSASRDTILRIAYVLRTCSMASSNKAYARLLLMFPELPPHRKKLYDYLKPDEEEKVLEVLFDKKSGLSYRDRAIGKLAYYTGMRRLDIANLKFDNIDLEKEEIHFVQQKTGIEITIPFKTAVGNAIVDYVAKERTPNKGEQVFLSTKKPYPGITGVALGRTSQKIFKAASIRQEVGRNRGMHVFRHYFVSDLISKDVRREVVSKLVGHVALESINSYLDADIEHLRECALDISDFSARAVDIAPFKSHASNLIKNYMDRCMQNGSWNRVVHQMLRSLDSFLQEKHADKTSLSDNAIIEWCKPLCGEYKEQYENRISALCAFIEFANVSGQYQLAKPVMEALSSDAKRTTRYDRVYGSRFSCLLRRYEAHCEPTGRWTKKRYFVLHNFDRFCMSRDDLSAQEQIDTWAKKSASEDLDALINRVAILNMFIKYVNLTESESLRTVRVAKPRNRPQKIIHVYHECSRVEIGNLFHACDELKPSSEHPESSYVCLVIPAMIRLLYSSGIRMKEARCLDMSDVDLEYGIINIRHTKGHIEHRVALHPSMKEYLQAYDRKMNILHPGRRCFFPNDKDKYFSDTWIWNWFRNLWYKYNCAEATCYCLRHNYATTNINSWPASANVLDGRLLYLSRSMGHAKMDTTMYYYHFTHTASQRINSIKAKSFNEIIPDRLSLYKRDEAE